MTSRKPTSTIHGIRCAVLGACLALASPAGLAQNTSDAPWVGNWANGEPCKGGFGTIGPFDYLRRDKLQGQLMVVEEHHFTEDVENLVRGATTEPMGDIDFVLRAWPNHHRALQSAVTFRLRHKKWPKKSKGLPAECYLQRAMNFSPRDPVPVVMLAHVMHKKGNPEEAIKAYMRAQELVPGDMVMKYNMGLAMTDAERWVQAREVAKEVYATDFPLPGLKNRLIRAGKWQEAATEETPDSESAGEAAVASTGSETASGAGDGTQGDTPTTGTGTAQPVASAAGGETGGKEGGGAGVEEKDAGAQGEPGDSALADRAENNNSDSKPQAGTGKKQQQAGTGKKQQQASTGKKQQQAANKQQPGNEKPPASKGAVAAEQKESEATASELAAKADQPTSGDQAKAEGSAAEPAQKDAQPELTEEEKAAIAKANWEAKRDEQRKIEWAKAMFKTEAAETDEEGAAAAAAAAPSNEPDTSVDDGDTSSKARWMKALKQAESQPDATEDATPAEDSAP